ncbi:hypothetical protein [Haliangium ochraceum]|uniref:hypothetical protein n=1 Tax=Haliangium ochraceum TaxID=80816 RepID=UPI001269D5BA|nr:hypothetical protein [Haliangium ochraceum]
MQKQATKPQWRVQRIPSTLTLRALETRRGLPDAVLLLPEVRTAMEETALVAHPEPDGDFDERHQELEHAATTPMKSMKR